MLLKRQNLNNSLKLPQIEKRFSNNLNYSYTCSNGNHRITQIQKQNIDINNDDQESVSKLNQWSQNKPIKKSKKITPSPLRLNNRNSQRGSIAINSNTKRVVQMKQTHQAKQLAGHYKFIDIQLYIAKIDYELHKIGQVNYSSIYKNMQYCSGVYQNSFNTTLKIISKYQMMIKSFIQQNQKQIEQQRQQHIRKVNEIQEKQYQNYKYQIDQVREHLQDREDSLRPVKKILKSLAASRIKVLKYCLALGYDIRQEGLVWILKQLGEIPKMDQFPKFLTEKQINFIIAKYTNEYEVSHCEKKMKNDIFGKTINEAYQFVNRKKRRELSLIKQNQALDKFYVDKVKNYSPANHSYLYDSTLEIAQQIQKKKPRPTRYQIIYKQAARKLNKICRLKIHQNSNKTKNKQNKTPQKQGDAKSAKSFKKRKQKRKSTLIVEQLGKMLQLSLNQTKKMQQVYTKQQKQLQQILRHIRLQKYSAGHNKMKINENKFQSSQQFMVRNPISIIGCLVGWKKAQKIIQQEMFRF